MRQSFVMMSPGSYDRFGEVISILATLNILDLGVKRVLAKAISEAHGRILQKLGVSEVLFPEKDLAVAVACRPHNLNMIDYLPFIEGYSIIQIPPLRQ